MALIDIKLFSTTLLTNTDIRVVVPTPDEPFYSDETPFYKPGKKYQVLYLLHGAHGDCTVWTRNTGIERYAQAHKLIVVSASVTNSCYLDMAHGSRFMTYMTKELPAFINSVFPVSTRPEDTFIAGISMGGYGTYRLALENPERFACAVSISGALDMASMVDSAPAGTPASLNFTDIFGEAPVRGSDNDILALLKKRIAEGRPIPKLYQCCGTEDFLYRSNLQVKKELEKLPVDYTYDESPGIHNWDYWDPQIRKVLDWLPLADTLVDG